jgi:hypothetical protein
MSEGVEVQMTKFQKWLFGLLCFGVPLAPTLFFQERAFYELFIGTTGTILVIFGILLLTQSLFRKEPPEYVNFVGFPVAIFIFGGAQIMHLGFLSEQQGGMKEAYVGLLRGIDSLPLLFLQVVGLAIAIQVAIYLWRRRASRSSK